MSDLFPELEEQLKDYDILRDLTPSGAVWGDIPWNMLTDKDKQEIIDYYKAHPDIENPYYAETGVGKAPLSEPNYTGIEGTYIGGTAVSNPSPEPPYTTTGGPKIQAPTNILIKQYLEQYWWIVLIIVAVVVYFVFFRKKRRRR